MRFTGGAIVVGLALLLTAAPAQAAQRFAAPAGTGTECTQAKPCSLKEAAVAAKAGDEVIVGAGTYPVSSVVALPNATNVQLHGDFSGPMPKIVASLPTWVLEIYEAGDSISYLEIENNANGGGGIYCTAGRVERVRIRVVGSGGTGVLDYPDCSSIRNSQLLVDGSNSAALRTVTNGTTYKPSARNLTAIASGTGSSGVIAEYAGGVPGSITLELENSIVHGDAQDLRPLGNLKGTAVIAASHSNFVTAIPGTEGKVVDGGGNQTAPPLFVNAEGRDYREAAGSPTIDAGVADPLIGGLDLTGGPRLLGKAPDIGAYEFVPPVALIQSLAIKPGSFRAGNVAGAVASRRKKAAAPLGATVTYSLSAAGSLELSIERKLPGRRVGKGCVKQTAANKGHRKCSLFKPLKGGFSVSGATGPNSFKFSGRLGGKSLKPGSYRLTGAAGGAVQKAAFKIVK